MHGAKTPCIIFPCYSIKTYPLDWFELVSHSASSLIIGLIPYFSSKSFNILSLVYFEVLIFDTKFSGIPYVNGQFAMQIAQSVPRHLHLR